jgi:hypothetical protein
VALRRRITPGLPLSVLASKTLTITYHIIHLPHFNANKTKGALVFTLK